MTILQHIRVRDKMPVEQGRKSLTQDLIWDEKFFNTKKPAERINQDTSVSPPNKVVVGHQDSDLMHYNYESYNNNNNGKYANQLGNRPKRDRSLPKFDQNSNGERESGFIPSSQQQHNGYYKSYEDSDILMSSYGSSGIMDYNYTHSGYDEDYHHMHPDVGKRSQQDCSRLTKSLNFSSMGNGLHLDNNYADHPCYLQDPDSMDLYDGRSDNNIIPDGYATISRKNKGKDHHSLSSSASASMLRKSSDSGLLKLFRSQNNGLNENKFLAHSLALSSSGGTGSSGGFPNSQETTQQHHHQQQQQQQQRPNELKLSQTVHALPQHDIQVQHARMVYLKDTQPLHHTQPSSNYGVLSQSAPGTPDDISLHSPSESSTPDLDKRKYGSNSQLLNHSLNSSLNSSGDLDSSKKIGTNKSSLQTITESFGGMLKKKHKSTSSFEHEQQHQPRLLRSNSTPNVLEATEDEDVDQDDYGFLTYRSFRSKNHPFKPSNSTSGMQKAKSTADVLVQGQVRSLSKKWKKPKVTQSKSAPVSTWKPQGHCTWSGIGGKRLVLTPSHLLHITEHERLVLQKTAHAKLQNMGLGCTIVIPKESRTKRTKSRVFTLKKRSSSGGLLDNFKDRNKDGKDTLNTGWVFGNVLSKVIYNDKELGHGCPCPLRERKESVDLTRPERKSSSSSVSRDPRYFSLVVCACTDIDSIQSSAVHNALHVHNMHHNVHHAQGCAVSTESLSESDSRSTGSTLLDALSLSSTGKGETSKENEPSMQPHTPRVPYIVHSCFKHIETYGLNTLGIFRIAGVKKRVKQLREEFDSGNEVNLEKDWSPHEVGALLKEFFRDLSDPLLTRDLYTAFVATCKLKDVHKRLHAQRLLITLLPPANRDTLFALLRFLNVVVEHSSDTVDQYGQEVTGNKMDSNNLATLFGPNILHKAKGGEFQVESPERAEQRSDVIAVVKDMIENYVQIFEIPPDLEDEVFRAMLESSPEALDVLLRRKCHIQGLDIDGESSSMCEENDSLSASQTSDFLTMSLKPRTLSEAVSLSQEQQQQPQRTTTPIIKESRHHQQQPHMPRTFNEVLALQQQQKHQHHNLHKHDTSSSSSQKAQQKTHQTVVQRRERTSSAKDASPNKHQHASLKLFRRSTPDPIWTKRDSPHVSPSPKAMKATVTPNLRVQVTPDSASPSSAERTKFLSSAKAFLSPRTSRKKQEEQQQQYNQKSNSNLLTVPTAFTRTSSGRDSNKHASNSSLSSGYFGGSSRSGTTSPVTPETPPHHHQYHHHHQQHSSGNNNSSNSSYNKWYLGLETPPHTPPSGGQVFDFSQPSSSQQPSQQQNDINSGSFQRTSSLSRPLGITRSTSSPSPSPTLPHWQAERWKHWEEVAKQRSDETQEQETLV